MKLRSEPIPYSSIVGGGLSLVDENNRPRFQIVFIGTTEGISKEQTIALARQIDGFINTEGLDVP